MTFSQEMRHHLFWAAHNLKHGRSHDAIWSWLRASEAFEANEREQMEYQLDGLKQAAYEHLDALKRLSAITPDQLFNWRLPECVAKYEYDCKMSDGVAELVCLNLEAKEIERKLFV